MTVLLNIMDPMLASCLAVTCVFSAYAAGVSGTNLEDHVNRLGREANIDGYDIATVHATERGTGEHKKQTKRDLRAIADDPAGFKDDNGRLPLTLRLTSGEELRVSLWRRFLDLSGSEVYERSDSGRKRIDAGVSQCHFDGPLEGSPGHAYFTLCGGTLTGTINTDNKTYDVYALPPEISEQETKRALDDDLRVLVTWSDVGQGENDGVEIPGPADGEDKMKERDERHRKSVADQKVVVQIGDFVDSHHLQALEQRLGLTESQQIADHMLGKWMSVAFQLSDKGRMKGWDVTLNVTLEIWRRNPSWYVTSKTDKIGDRMNQICEGTKTMSFDQVTVHTSQTSSLRLIGVAWIGGVCRPRYRCAAIRTVSNSFLTELHEFGHSLGLKHDNQMPSCSSDNDVTGFMGGKTDHYRACYNDILDSAFRNPRNACLFSSKQP